MVTGPVIRVMFPLTEKTNQNAGDVKMRINRKLDAVPWYTSGFQ